MIGLSPQQNEVIFKIASATKLLLEAKVLEDAAEQERLKHPDAEVDPDPLGDSLAKAINILTAVFLK